jgi:hypothetical protein
LTGTLSALFSFIYTFYFDKKAYLTFKYYFFLGFLTGLLSSLISLGYSYFFNIKLLDFSEILPYWKIIALDFALALVLSGNYFAFSLVVKRYYVLIFNVFFALLSILSVLIPITAQLPNIEFPEFYPTFAIPLHLIFSVIFLSLSSIIIKDEN